MRASARPVTLTAIGSGLVLLLSLLLPWYAESPPPGAFYAEQSYSAFSAFALEDLVLALLAIATVLVGLRLRALLRPRGGSAAELVGACRMLTVVGGVAAAIVAVRIVALPAPSVPLATIGVQFGALVGLFAALVAAGTGVWAMQQAPRAESAAPRRRPRPPTG